MSVKHIFSCAFLAQDVIYASRTYATMSLLIVAISLNLLTESLLDGWTGNSNDDFVYIFLIVGAAYLKNGLC